MELFTFYGIVYRKKLQHVREEKPDKMLDDPSFYKNIEEDIYDDSSKFVPSLDYQKQCSIKRMNEGEVFAG